jgi:hypothetical protein
MTSPGASPDTSVTSDVDDHSASTNIPYLDAKHFHLMSCNPPPPSLLMSMLIRHYAIG